MLFCQCNHTAPQAEAQYFILQLHAMPLESVDLVLSHRSEQDVQSVMRSHLYTLRVCTARCILVYPFDEGVWSAIGVLVNTWSLEYGIKGFLGTRLNQILLMFHQAY